MVSLLSQPPTKRELLKFVPDSALWCASLGMEPSSFWKTLSSVVATNDSHPIADFEKETGLDVQRDLAPVLGDEVAVYGGPPEFEKAGAVANLVLVFKSANPLAASQTFEKVLKDIAARWPAPPPPAEPEGAKPPAKPAAPPGSKPENAPVASQTSPTGGPAKGKEAAPPPVKVAAFFSDVPYRNHVIRVLTLPEKGHAPNLSLTAGVDYVIIARTPDLARYALDAVDNLRPSLRSDAAFADLARHVASGESALVYFNTKASLDVVQRLSRERGQELFREQTLSIDYSKLPLADVISRHALGSVLVAVNDKTGLKFEAYSPAGLAATLLLAGLEHSAGMPASLDPRNVLVGCVAANNLAMIGAALRRYAQDHNGSFPPGGNQAHELVSSGRVRNLRLFYMPLSNVDFSGFPDNIDLQFTILNCTLSDDPKTMIAWDRHKDPMGGRHVLRLDGSVQWLSDQQFMDQIK
jgi:hypothetical protein